MDSSWPDMYECPPFHDDTKCKFDQQSESCNKPNYWREWLIMHKGRKKSIQTLSEEYQRFKSFPEGFQKKRMCESIKAQGKSHELDVTKIGDPLVYYILQEKIDMAAYDIRRNQILKYLIKTWNFRNKFSLKKFDKHKLKKVFQAIDLFYFNNTLLKNWRRSKKIRISYRIKDEDKPYVMKTDTYKSHGKVTRVKFVMNKKYFSAEYIRGNVDEVDVTSKLHYLLLNSEHEMGHALVDVYKPEMGMGDDGGHTIIWNLVVNRIFGHSELLNGCHIP